MPRRSAPRHVGTVHPQAHPNLSQTYLHIIQPPDCRFTLNIAGPFQLRLMHPARSAAHGSDLECRLRTTYLGPVHTCGSTRCPTHPTVSGVERPEVCGACAGCTRCNMLHAQHILPVRQIWWDSPAYELIRSDQDSRRVSLVPSISFTRQARLECVFVHFIGACWPELGLYEGNHRLRPHCGRISTAHLVQL